MDLLTVGDSDVRREGDRHCPLGVGCVVDQLILPLNSVEGGNGGQNARRGAGGGDELDDRVVVLGGRTRVHDVLCGTEFGKREV